MDPAVSYLAREGWALRVAVEARRGEVEISMASGSSAGRGTEELGGSEGVGCMGALERVRRVFGAMEWGFE